MAAEGGGGTSGTHTDGRHLLTLTQAQVLARLTQPPPLPRPVSPQSLTLALASQPLWIRIQTYLSPALLNSTHHPTAPSLGLRAFLLRCYDGNTVTEWGQLNNSLEGIPVLVSGPVDMAPHLIKGLCRGD